VPWQHHVACKTTQKEENGKKISQVIPPMVFRGINQ
jgi:hypothetical protein